MPILEFCWIMLDWGFNS